MFDKLFDIGYLIFKDILAIINKAEQNPNMVLEIEKALGKIQRTTSDILLQFEIGTAPND